MGDGLRQLQAFLALAQCVSHLFHALDGVTQCDMRSDPRDDFLPLERLGDVVDAALLKGFHLVFHVGRSADEDHGSLPQSFVRLDPTADFEAAHARHTDVQQDQLRCFDHGRAQGQFAVVERAHHVPLRRQDVFQQFECRGVVVNDEDVAYHGVASFPAVRASSVSRMGR